MAAKDAKVMSELEALKAVTSQSATDTTDDEKSRRRTASQRVYHFIQVFELRQKWLAEGNKPEDFTHDVATDLMVADWDSKKSQAIGVTPKAPKPAPKRTTKTKAA